jgi:Uma2 family endonuclease
VITQTSAQPRFSVDQFIQIGDLGVFDDRRVELRGGRLIEMAAPGPEHRTLVTRLQSLFAAANGERRLEVQQGIVIDDFDMPMPDLMVLRAPVDWRNIVPADVWLLIEIAVSHPERDLDKLAHYLRVGIPEVWIVNIPLRRVELYRPPEIVPERIAERGDSIRSVAPDLPLVDVGALFEDMP